MGALPKELAGLSGDARFFGGSMFGLATVIGFGMQQSRPSDRSQGALDELVAAGIISRTDERSGRVEYRRLVDCMPLVSVAEAMRETIGDWPVAVPIQKPAQRVPSGRTKLTKAQRRYLEGFGVRDHQLAPDGPGKWPLQYGLLAAGLCEHRDFLFYITAAGRDALMDERT